VDERGENGAAVVLQWRREDIIALSVHCSVECNDEVAKKARGSPNTKAKIEPRGVLAHSLVQAVKKGVETVNRGQ
jgi:hypothetical protein